MRRRHLHVDQLHAHRARVLGQRDERHLGGVGPPVKHRLRREEPADRDAVEPACERAVDPDLDAVRPAQPVQPCVGLADGRRDPRLVVVAAVGAAGHDVVERRVDGHAEPAAAQRAREGPGDVHAVGREHGARIRRPPEQVDAVGGPREDAAAVGGQQRGRLEVAAAGEQAVGVGLARIGKADAARSHRRRAPGPRHHDVEGRVAHPLSAPAVSPRMRWRCRNVKSTATGSVLMMTPAES